MRNTAKFLYSVFSKAPTYGSSININVISRYVVMRLQITSVNGNDLSKYL